MLPPERRLPGAGELIARGHYFVVHAPRQSGKTTAFRTLAQRLSAEGELIALLTSCEEGQRLEKDLEGSIDTLYLEKLGLEAGTLVIFDQRKKAPPIAERGAFGETRHGSRRITILRL